MEYTLSDFNQISRVINARRAELLVKSTYMYPENILERVQRLEPAALAQIHDQYYPEIYRYVRYRLDDEQLCEDLTAEVFLRLLKALHKNRGPNRNLRGWLFGTASNLVNDHLRSRYARKVVSLEIDDEHLSNGEHPEDSYEADWIQREMSPEEWVVDGMRVLITPDTEVSPDIQEGYFVTVVGSLQPGGVVLATRVDPREFEVNGVIEKASADRWVVSGVSVLLPPEIGDILGLAIGSRVQLRVIRLVDGSLLVRMVDVLSVPPGLVTQTRTATLEATATPRPEATATLRPTNTPEPAETEDEHERETEAPTETPEPTEDDEDEEPETPEPTEDDDDDKATKTPKPTEDDDDKATKTPKPTDDDDDETTETPEPTEDDKDEATKTPKPTDDDDDETTKTLNQITVITLPVGVFSTSMRVAKASLSSSI